MTGGRSGGAPRWAMWLVERAAPPEQREEAAGDIEEAHHARITRRGRVAAHVLTALEAMDMAFALVRERRRQRRIDTKRGRSGHVPGVSWLDFKLGLRMLARYPGLTVVGGLAMAFGIALGAGAFQLVTELMTVPLPYSEPERVVRIRMVRADGSAVAPTLHDLALWREQLSSVELLGGLQERERNLAVGTGGAAPVQEAAVSAAAFQLVQVPPLLGRVLLPEDEAPAAAPVAVIGYDVWQSRLGGDRSVVGRSVLLGGEPVTVVGVMPEAFMLFMPQSGFTTPTPQNVWTPFRLDPLEYAAGAGPGITVFGRLAAGATAAEARAELAAVAAREAAGSEAHLRPDVLAFGERRLNSDGAATTGLFTITAVFLSLVMVILCANVALMLFARAATRESEIAVRSALGASRSRIVFQLFTEAVVLAAVSIPLGLLGAALGVKWVVGVLESVMQTQGLGSPSWIGSSLSPSTIAYAAILALVGAVVAGVLPGLTITGRRGAARLQQVAGRGAGVRMSGVWTVIVVTQVALTVVLVPVAVLLGLQVWELRAADHRLPAAEYLSVRLHMDAGTDPGGATPEARAARDRLEAAYTALATRVVAEPSVSGVTIGNRLPGSDHPSLAIEVEGRSGPDGSAAARKAQTASVGADFFEVMGGRIVAGRSFTPVDAGPEQSAIVVNESFVREFLGGGSAIGQRVRFPDANGADAERWYGIVGVTEDLAMSINATIPHNAGIYLPATPRDLYPFVMVMRLAGDPAAFTPRLREIAADAAPALRLIRPVAIDQAARGLLIAYDSWFRVILLGGVMAILLTNTGIYAIIAFTVARRTREIGIRVALGADRTRIVTAILGRTARHVAIGVLSGAGVALLMMLILSQGSWRPPLLRGGGLLLAYMTLMMGVCMLACVVPTRRALRIEPTQALSSDA